jgi:hypothetical protein
LGIRTSEIASFFGSIPISVRPILKKTLKFLQHISEIKRSFSDSTENDISTAEAQCRPDMTRYAGYGVLEILYDTKTMTRTSLHLNSELASLLANSTKDELFAQLVNDELNFFFPKIDLLFLMIDDILHEFCDRARYFRLITEHSGVRKAKLTRCSALMTFDHMGQLNAVSCFNISHFRIRLTM